MESQLVKLKFITIKREDSMMLISYNKGLSIDLEVAKQIVNERLAFFDGGNYPLLIDGRNVKLLTQEARGLFFHGTWNEGSNRSRHSARWIPDGNHGKTFYEAWARNSHENFQDKRAGPEMVEPVC